MWLLSSKGLSTLIVYTGGIPFLINLSFLFTHLNLFDSTV